MDVNYQAEELFECLESDKGEVVQEIKQIIYDQFAEVKEPWLINGLYDYYGSLQAGSSRCLELILSVRDPHDRFLCDRLTEGMKSSSSKEAKARALIVLGYLIRKSPSWLYKITQRPLIKELIRILKNDEDVEILLSALLDLVCLMPALPGYITPFLNELFEIFSRITDWRHNNLSILNEVHRVHLQVALLSFFHRLYGMFPCNFLHFLRIRYSESNSSSNESLSVFQSSIKPMLVTVRLHPLLVSTSREREKSPSRWKKMELHDVIVESSRYALLPQEFNNEEVLEYSSEPSVVFPDKFPPLPPSSETYVTPLDALWTPGHSKPSEITPPQKESTSYAVTTAPQSVENLESPPETAIEATPETTPFVTPSKDENIFHFNRPSSNVARSLRLDLSNVRSPVSFLTSPTVASKSLVPSSPSSFSKIPDFLVSSPECEDANHASGKRRDSLFDRPPGESGSASKLNKLGSERKKSPVKFVTSSGAEAPLRRPVPSKNGILSLDNLRDALPDFEKEDDDEITKITGGDESRSFTSVSRKEPMDNIKSGFVMSSPVSGADCNEEEEDDEAHLHPPLNYRPSLTNNSSVLEFVRQIQGRMRYISFCDGGYSVEGYRYGTTFDDDLETQKRRRFYSCPDPSKLTKMSSKLGGISARRLKNSLSVTRTRSSSSGESRPSGDVTLVREERDAYTQTDHDYKVFQYEHLFPVVLASTVNGHLKKEEDENPYSLLDKYLNSVCESRFKDRQEDVYKSIISSLQSQLLYERHRREVLGERNRRLLGKSKSSRILKEENTALKDRLQLVKSEIDDLHRQIEEIRREKHHAEEERSRTARNRDHEIEKSSVEIRSLKIEGQKYREMVSEQFKIIELGRKELDASKAECFLMKAELEVLQQKESVRKMTESELVRLRKELLMMSELQRKYLEHLDRPSANIHEETLNLFKEAYEKQIQASNRALESKTVEMEAFKSRVAELESSLSKKEAQIVDHRRLIKRIQEENEEILKESKTTYSSMVQLHLQTESHILELKNQLAQHTRILGGKTPSAASNVPSSSSSSSTSSSRIKKHRPPGLLDFHATRNVDIERPEAFSPTDRSFVVGSPPLSSGGSIGSDKSEVMRRALESTRPIKFKEEEDEEKEEEESNDSITISIKDSFESSLNGNHSS